MSADVKAYFFTELNRRCFTFALLFLQLHFHRYLSILVWESEGSRNMVKMFSVTCLSNSWKKIHGGIGHISLRALQVSFKCMCCSRYVNCQIGAWCPRGLHLACTFEAHFASMPLDLISFVLEVMKFITESQHVLIAETSNYQLCKTQD